MPTMSQEAAMHGSNHSAKKLIDLTLPKGTPKRRAVYSSSPPPVSPPRARVARKYPGYQSVLLPGVIQQYSTCLTRKDLLSRMQDGPLAVKPRPPSKPVKVWPPENHDHTFRPPKLEKLPLPFSVSSCPGMFKKTYEGFLTHWKDYLELPLTDDEKARWIDMEVERLSQFATLVVDWMDYETIVPRIDERMYRPLLEFFARFIPFRTDVDDIRGTTHSIEMEQRDWVVLALGYKKVQPSCLVRLLHMTHLDVCAEIQDIARQSPAVELKEGQPQWSKLKTLTPQHGKAKSILEWVFHAARPDKSIHEGSCNFIKLGDGWNTIWFYVDKGVIQVGPTMTPYITSEPGPDAQIGLMHILLACASKAGRDHHRQNRMLLQSTNQTGVTGVAASSSSSTAKVTDQDDTAEAPVLATIPAVTDDVHAKITSSIAAPAAEPQVSERAAEENTSDQVTPLQTSKAADSVVAPVDPSVPALPSKPHPVQAMNQANSTELQCEAATEARKAGPLSVLETSLARSSSEVGASRTADKEAVASKKKSKRSSNRPGQTRSSRAQKSVKPRVNPKIDPMSSLMGEQSPPEMSRRETFKRLSTTPHSSTRQSPRKRHATIRFPLDQHTHKSLYADPRDSSPNEANAHVTKKARLRA